MGKIRKDKNLVVKVCQCAWQRHGGQIQAVAKCISSGNVRDSFRDFHGARVCGIVETISKRTSANTRNTLRPCDAFQIVRGVEAGIRYGGDLPRGKVNGECRSPVTTVRECAGAEGQCGRTGLKHRMQVVAAFERIASDRCACSWYGDGVEIRACAVVESMPTYACDRRWKLYCGTLQG